MIKTNLANGLRTGYDALNTAIDWALEELNKPPIASQITNLSAEEYHIILEVVYQETPAILSEYGIGRFTISNEMIRENLKQRNYYEVGTLCKSYTNILLYFLLGFTIGKITNV